MSKQADAPTYETALELVADSANAVKPGPGKFEGCDDERLGEVLYYLSNDGFALDAYQGNVEFDFPWTAWMGRFVLTESTHGFFGYEVYETEREAEVAYTRAVR